MHDALIQHHCLASCDGAISPLHTCDPQPVLSFHLFCTTLDCMLPVQSPSSCVLQFAHPSISHAPSRAFSLPPRFAAGPVIVGSAGSKGSGKSTLLNKLFDTDFGVGRSLGPAARPQGGVALCAAGDGVLMCVDYDAVGTGAEEATTNGKILALTTRLADVIVLNLWSSDVGRNVPYNTLALQVKGGGEMGKVESIRDTPISCVFFSFFHPFATPSPVHISVCHHCSALYSLVTLPYSFSSSFTPSLRLSSKSNSKPKVRPRPFSSSLCTTMRGINRMKGLGRRFCRILTRFGLEFPRVRTRHMQS